MILIIHQPFDLRATTFGRILHMGEGRVCMKSSTPPCQLRAGPLRPQNYWDSLSTPRRTVRPRATKFGVLTHVGSSVFLGGQPRPHPKWAVPSVPKKFGTSYIRAHSNSNKQILILHGDKTRRRNFLQGRPRMLTRDLFAVANLLVLSCIFIVTESVI